MDTRTFLVSRERNIHRSLRVRRVGLELRHSVSQLEFRHCHDEPGRGEAIDQSAVESAHRRQWSKLNLGLDRE
jgi:hypothetical protein